MAKRKASTDAPRKHLDPMEFVRIWQTSESLADVVKATGLKTTTLNMRATVARKKHGIPLKKFGRRSKYTPELLSEMKELAESLVNGDE